MENKLVSIIIAAFNAERYILSTVESVLNQTYENIELIVVNDGSKDSTLDLLYSISDTRLQVISQNNQGQDIAFNHGFKYAKGEYIKFMDADDIISPRTIEIQINALEKEPNKIAYGEWYRFFSNEPSEKDLKPPMDYWKDMLPIDFLISDDDGPMLQCGIMLIPRSIIEKAGLWNEDLILYNDTEFFTRIILNSTGVIFTKGAKLFYRSGLSNSLTSQNTRKFFESTFKATNLLAGYMLSYEDSKRVRQLIANIYFRRLYDMYPNFKDLAKKHEDMIKIYGGSSLKIRGGFLFNISYNTIGWKLTKKLYSFYKNGH